MKRLRHEIQISDDWCFEIDWKKRWGFGFLIAPAAIHFRVWRLWLSLVNEGYLRMTDDLIKNQDVWFREKIYKGKASVFQTRFNPKTAQPTQREADGAFCTCKSSTEYEKVGVWLCGFCHHPRR